MIKQFFFYLLTFSTCLFAFNFSVFAQTPDESTPEVEESTVQENIKQRLQKVIDEQKEYVQGVSASSLRGRIGKIERVSEETLNVKTRKGNVIISFSQNVELLLDNKVIQKKDIEVDSDVVLIGVDEGDDFITQRVLISRKPLQPTIRQIVVGNVTKTDRRTITIVPRNSTEEQTYSIDAKATTILDNQSESIPFTNIEADQDVLLIVRTATPTTTSATPSPSSSSSGTVLVLRSLGGSSN